MMKMAGGEVSALVLIKTREKNTGYGEFIR